MLQPCLIPSSVFDMTTERPRSKASKKGGPEPPSPPESSSEQLAGDRRCSVSVIVSEIEKENPRHLEGRHRRRSAQQRKHRRRPAGSSSDGDDTCKGKEVQKPLDLALLFVGREVIFLKCLFEEFMLNFVFAFPAYLVLDIPVHEFAFFRFELEQKGGPCSFGLVQGFAEACGHDLGIGNVAFLGSCVVEDANHEESAALHSIEDFLTKRKEESDKGATDLVVFSLQQPSSIHLAIMSYPRTKVSKSANNGNKRNDAEMHSVQNAEMHSGAAFCTECICA
ncbi:putative transmembrane protein [Senna tora]|uniref:Putative transmembrane protein n=1 Tax=Senna tora TaxID=362788 RepID=A0A834VZU0_9FABA|nr:putative transmembrane protein [Senna tora]